MFLGQYLTTFSGKGRIILPKKFRQELRGKTEIVVSRGFEQCIWGFNLDVWQKQADKYLETPASEDAARALRRYIFSASEILDLDRQGRFVIPAMLLSYANLEGEVALVGAGDHFEIWNKERWENYRKRLEKSYEKNI